MPTVSVAADFKAYAAFAKTLDKAAATAFRAGIRKAVKTVGDESLQRAKQNASWSTGHTSREAKKYGKGDVHGSIPDSLSLRTSFGARTAGVKMRADRKKAPHAYIFERGSKGGGGKIRHPVFEKPVPYRWTPTFATMDTRKFFYRAVWDHKDDLKNQMQEELRAAARDLGFTG